ncbi:MAG: hypothetical protein IJR90_01685 [Clostridia bacterium]|nr:hypothetical protein [Clostridia bacterium]
MKINNERKNANAGRKRILITAAVSAALLLAAAAVLYFILSAAAKKELSPEYEFCEPDWDITADDIASEPDYAELGWYITYQNELGESVTILDDDYLKYGIGVELMSYYFAAIQAGDEDTYNSLFGGDYYAEHEKHGPFTPQRIYDIKLKLTGSQSNGDGTAVYTYEIGYKIMRNDGTFTTLIGSDMSRPQFVTVVAAPDDVYIEKIETQGRG